MNRKAVTLMASAVGVSSFSIFGLFGGKKTETDSASQTQSAPVPVPVSGGSSSSNSSVSLPTSVQVNPSDFFKYGFPGPVHDLESKQEFVSCYNRQTRNPYWVLEHITKESIKLNPGVDRKKSIFKEDQQIPPKFRALLRDYFRSGYDRGHQAPAADAKFSQQAMDETFDLTNISPQVGDGFNRDYWAHFEDFTRRLTNKYDSVRIITGPLYLPKKFPDGKFRVVYEVIGNPPNVAVPTHFFKLVVGENDHNATKEASVAAFVLPNDKIDNDTKLTDFQVPVDALEKSSGLTFFTSQVASNLKLKNLCQEVSCSIIVRDFSNKAKQLGSGTNFPALPGK